MLPRGTRCRSRLQSAARPRLWELPSRCSKRVASATVEQVFAMAWFTRQKPGVEGSSEGEEKRVRTEGLWLKCESCSQIVWKKALDENLQCCPKCEFHFRIDARTRLGMLFDGGYEEFDTGMTSRDPLRLDDAYRDKLAIARETTQLSDALLSAAG